MPKRRKGLKAVKGLPDMPVTPPPPPPPMDRPSMLEPHPDAPAPRYSQTRVPTERIADALNRVSASGLVPIHMCDAMGNETWIVFERPVD